MSEIIDYATTVLNSKGQGFKMRVEAVFSRIQLESSPSTLPLLQQGFSLKEQQQSIQERTLVQANRYEGKTASTRSVKPWLLLVLNGEQG